MLMVKKTERNLFQLVCVHEFFRFDAKFFVTLWVLMLCLTEA